MKFSKQQYKQPAVVRHNQHTFVKHHTYEGQLYSITRVTFQCKVCGLCAIADRINNNFRNWAGEGSKISCGDRVCSIVMNQ